jgi:hypothetical protein
LDNAQSDRRSGLAWQQSQKTMCGGGVGRAGFAGRAGRFLLGGGLEVLDAPVDERSDRSGGLLDGISLLGCWVEKKRPEVYGGREAEGNESAVYVRASIGYPAVARSVATAEPVEFRWRVEMSTLSWPF